MNGTEYSNFKLDSVTQTLANEELFAQWMRKFFYLNDALSKEYDTIYQSTYYVVFYELVTVGLEYSETLLDSLRDSTNDEKKELYSELVKGLKDCKSLFSDKEFEFIEYKRHSASHIFQTHYDKRLTPKGKLIDTRKKRSIDDWNSEFSEILIKYGFDKGFDKFMTSQLYPRVNEIYAEYQRIKTHYNTV